MPALEALRGAVRARNGEIYFEAAVEFTLGVLFSALTFGFVFWIAWLFGFCSIGRSIGLSTTSFALIVTAIFALVTTFSAWRRVDPLADVAPLSGRQEMLTLLSIATPGLLYFSPRHATAGAAVLLLAGPTNVLTAIGTFRHRLRASEATLRAASNLLDDAATGVPAESIEDPHSALLLKRLALIKLVPGKGLGTIELTEKGRTLAAT